MIPYSNAEYYAHIAEDGRIQTVKQHLAQTAERSAYFANSFHAEEQGRLIGLAHDIGKCSDAFQNRLNGGEIETILQPARRARRSRGRAGVSGLALVCPLW